MNLAIFRPAPQIAVADLQLGTSVGTPRTGGDGLFDQQPGGLAMWGADHASSSPPQIAETFFLRMSSAAASASAFSLRQFPLQILDPLLLFLRRLTQTRRAGAIPIVRLFAR